jgi:hypothetical protein
MEPKLTPQQALDLLAQAAAQFRGTRQEHELLARALSVLSAAISEAPAPKE